MGRQQFRRSINVRTSMYYVIQAAADRLDTTGSGLVEAALSVPLTPEQEADLVARVRAGMDTRQHAGVKRYQRIRRLKRMLESHDDPDTKEG